MEEERIYLWPGYLVITTLVLISLFFILVKISDETSFNQDYLSKDISLLEQSLFIAPGDVSLRYEVVQDEDRFKITFDDSCEVNVNIDDSLGFSGSSSWCGGNNYFFTDYPPQDDFDYLFFNKTYSDLIVEGGKNG